jgi:hypothetical protein
VEALAIIEDRRWFDGGGRELDLAAPDLRQPVAERGYPKCRIRRPGGVT